MPNESTYYFECDSRSSKAMIGVALYLTMLAALWVVFDAVVWLLVFLGIPAIPALVQLWNNPRSSMTLTARGLSWTNGQRTGEVALETIDVVRMDTRWDLSVRITFVLVDGTKLRLPPDLSSPHRQLEKELVARGQRVDRRHFTVI